ncbi:hypothetical protein G4B88_010389 [Cannabis sativa]|uniref:Late embryogenesis abundant protein n=2 Tax=Cannabis sativa TaxID=3483 RepID=A0A7J6I5V6_CANSA|nr:hypothetical protein G4B88_010389 [Cannabis sativa]
MNILDTFVKNVDSRSEEVQKATGRRRAKLPTLGHRLANLPDEKANKNVDRSIVGCPTKVREGEGPFGRKASYHKNSIRETMKMEKEEVSNVRHINGGHDHDHCDEVSKNDGNEWIPDVRTGIYYPKGHEKVMEDVPPKAGKDINWMSYSDNIH